MNAVAEFRSTEATRTPSPAALSDWEIVTRVCSGESEYFEILMRRHNRRLYRAVRSILRDDVESQDVVQETYLNAYAKLYEFAGRASFGTWLLRIGINQALKRAGRLKTAKLEDFLEVDRFDVEAGDRGYKEAEREFAIREITSMLEVFIDELPTHLRVVFVLRDVEQLTPTETANALNVREITVRTRLHRARRYLRNRVYQRFGDAVLNVFEFDGWQCDKIVAAVSAALGIASCRAAGK